MTAWNFWDGSNHKSHILGEDSFDVEEIDEDEEKKILAEFSGAIHVSKGAYESEETENYIFTTSLYASDPWLASVE